MAKQRLPLYYGGPLKATRITGTSTFNISGAGPHVIGPNNTNSEVFLLLRADGADGPFVPSGAGSYSSGFESWVKFTIPVGNDGYGSTLFGNFTEADSGTHPIVASVRIDRPTIIDAGGSISNAASLVISNAPTAGTRNYALWVDDGETRLDGVLNVQGTGPHAIGGDTDTDFRLSLLGTFSPVTSGGAAVQLLGTLNAPVDGDLHGMDIIPTLAEAASGTHTLFTSLRVRAPTISAGGASLTNAAALYVQSAPTAATNNYALWIDAGTTRLDGVLLQATVTTLANDATPSVSAGNLFKTGGTTAITDFDDGVVGQTIRILAEHTITVTDGTPVVLNGGANFGMVSSDTLTLTMFNDQIWHEVSRSVN